VGSYDLLQPYKRKGGQGLALNKVTSIHYTTNLDSSYLRMLYELKVGETSREEVFCSVLGQLRVCADSVAFDANHEDIC